MKPVLTAFVLNANGQEVQGALKMKTEICLAILCLAAASVPALAQNAAPACGPANFDQTRNAFTVVNPAPDAVNQQCLLTVYPRGAAPAQARQFPAFYPVEGRYVIELSGGGGGGGGGASGDQGGGGGGAGAAPSRTVQYLSPGVYKLTLGTGGMGGSAEGGRTAAGNPTSLTVANSGQLVAGFQGADVASQVTRAASDGSGGVAKAGGSMGGSGGDSGARIEESAQSGGSLRSPAYSGMPGQAGVDSGRNDQANAGGGGGASVGSGGAGESAGRSNAVAGVGNLGGGGGGGRGGAQSADAGGRGGHGFIRLTLAEPAPQAVAPAPAPAPVPVVQRFSLSSDMLFGFGQSKLRPAGEAKLDDLASKLQQVNISSITYTGHADRIGSSEINQAVSLSRAESVKAYLAGKGVRAERVLVEGKGETEPVSSSAACKGNAGAAVIACLQPDRRVDIDVVGTAK
jgi:outer membrane protein OmpA-like peptidoglycan-associated protein